MSGYTEDHLIEQPAIQLMEHKLGWDSLNAYEPPSSREAVLRRSSGLTNCPDAAVEEMTRERSALSLVEGNREIDKFLRGGVKVTIPDRERGGQRTEVVRVVAWDVHEYGVVHESRGHENIVNTGLIYVQENATFTLSVDIKFM